MTEIDHDDLIRRAMAAWFKVGKGYPLHDQPSPARSSVETTGEDHTYVVLRNVNGITVVYRVKNNGALKRLVRVPVAFRETAP